MVLAGTEFGARRGDFVAILVDEKLVAQADEELAAEMPSFDDFSFDEADFDTAGLASATFTGRKLKQASTPKGARPGHVSPNRG